MFNILIYSSVFFPTIPLIIGFFRWGKLSSIQRILVFIILTTLISDLLTLSLRQTNHNNHWVYHIYVPVFFILLIFLYKKLLANLPQLFFHILQFSFLFFCLINSLFFQNINSFNSNAVTVAWFIYLYFALTYFYQLLKNPPNGSLIKNPVFWFNTGIILYHSSTIILFGVLNHLLKQSNEVMYASWVLNIIFTIVLNCFYLLTICIKSTQ